MLTIEHRKRYMDGSRPLPAPTLLINENGSALLINPRRRSIQRDSNGRLILFCSACGGRGRVACWLDEIICEDCAGTGRATR